MLGHGARSFKDPTSPARAVAIASKGTQVFEHILAPPDSTGLLTYMWIESGNFYADRYIGDNLIMRYYVDGEAHASLEFTPSMMAGSGIGLESLACTTK